MCRRCPLKIQNKSFPIDLLIMSFDNFNVILGMEWLIEHNMILDCCKKKFSVQSNEGKTIEVKGIRLSDSTNIISSI